MSLKIEQKEHESVLILELDGRITAGEETGSLRTLIQELVAAGRPNIILGMKNVAYVDSTGLGALVMCHTTARKAGGALKLLELNERNIELLVLTKLTTVFEAFNDEQDAVNSYFPNRESNRFDLLEFVRQQKAAEE